MHSVSQQKIAALEVPVHHVCRVQDAHCHHCLRGPPQLRDECLATLQLLWSHPELIRQGAAHALHDQTPFAVHARQAKAAEHEGGLEKVARLENKKAGT